MYATKMFSKLALLGLLLLITIAPAVTSAATADYPALDTYIEAQMAAWHIPGAALVIVEDGRVAYLQTYGETAAGRPVTAETPFEIGSCAKSFTALAVMQLVEGGQIDLDAPVQRYLPWFEVGEAGAAPGITIRHLLNHSSGLPNTSRLTMANPNNLTLEEQVRAIQSLALSSEPGDLSQYSNLNYLTLALVIEAVSGRSYGGYLDENIFTPLGMSHSFTDPAEARDHGYAGGHTWWFGWPFPSLEKPRPDLLGAASIMVSPGDMAHYLITQLNEGVYDGRSVLSPAGVAAMHAPTRLAAEESIFGMGWVSYRENGQRVVNHNGQSSSFTCSMILLPDQQTGIAVLANVSTLHEIQAAWSMASRVKNMVISGWPPVVDPAFAYFYRLWNGGLLVATLILLWSIMAMMRHYPRLIGAAPRWRIVLPFVIDGSLAAVALLGLPLALGWLGWRGLFVRLPDAAYWCLAAGGLLLFKVGWRTAVVTGGLANRPKDTPQ